MPEEAIIFLIGGLFVLWVTIKMIKLTGRYNQPTRNIKCTVISKEDEKFTIGSYSFVKHMIVLQDNYNMTKEYRAEGKFKYLQYDKIEIGTRGTALLRGDIIYKFIKDGPKT